MDKKILVTLLIGAFFIGTIFFSGCAEITNMADDLIDSADDNEDEKEEESETLTHTECDDGECIEVKGKGEDECDKAEDCVSSTCTNTGKCKMVNEPGDIECDADGDCFDVLDTPFNVDAWGYEGWGDCTGQSGSWNSADAFCKCEGYEGALAASADPCYHEDVEDIRWKWNTENCPVIKGDNTGTGYALTKVMCLKAKSDRGA